MWWELTWWAWGIVILIFIILYILFLKYAYDHAAEDESDDD